MTSNIQFSEISEITPNTNVVYLLSDRSDLESLGLSDEKEQFVTSKFQQKDKAVALNNYSFWEYIVVCAASDKAEKREKIRLLGQQVNAWVNEHKIEELQVVCGNVSADIALLFLEGLALSNYQFLSYFSESHKKENSLASCAVLGVPSEDLEALEHVVDGVFLCRDWVNEPQVTLTAEELANRAIHKGREVGLTVESFDKEKITELGMGGLLAVNLGSELPPTFTVCHWKPKNHKNAQPIVCVGKGVVYDTGGLSLKPTPNSMDLMKSDMGGAATVFGAIYTAAKLNLPVWVIAILPATDNRPGKNAITPGDVIEMYNGKTVEVKNTDAEGRLILADGLSYGDQFKPELVLTWATLTGAAAYSIGPPAAVTMGSASEKNMQQLIQAGNRVHERMVEFPFWSDYDEEIKSDIADLSNLGGSWGGAITAGKFLKNFTDFEYIHVDIAGPCYLSSSRGYQPKGGSGFGVRVLVEFLKAY